MITIWVMYWMTSAVRYETGELRVYIKAFEYRTERECRKNARRARWQDAEVRTYCVKKQVRRK